VRLLEKILKSILEKNPGGQTHGKEKVGKNNARKLIKKVKQQKNALLTIRLFVFKFS